VHPFLQIEPSRFPLVSFPSSKIRPRCKLAHRSDLKPPHKFIGTENRQGLQTCAESDGRPKTEPTVVPISTAVMQPDAQPHASQQAVTRNAIRVGHKGGRGVPITQIYAVQCDEYAIYQAREVSVHFAGQSKEQAQRKAVLPISSARAEVNALVQGLVYREICDLMASCTGLHRSNSLCLAACVRRRQRQRNTDGRGSKGSRIGEACRPWSLPVFEMELWGGVILIGLLFFVSWLHQFPEASSNL
jgi:hypothetical protein